MTDLRIFVRHALAAFVVTVGVALAACSGGEVAAEEATLAGDFVETTTPDTGTAAGVTPPPATAPPEPKSRLRLARVARVIDGDTVETVDGRRIRLVQIDAPESGGECYGAQATAVLEAMLPRGSQIGLERDPQLDDVDRYGRRLRYVFKGRRNLNVVLVRRGAASVWFFDGDRGRYADRLLATARTAKARKRGAWGACRAQLDPSGAFETATKVPARRQTAIGAACMSGYSPCLPITGDLDCADVRALGKAPVVVSGDDPYRLDGDGNGYGCE